MSTSGGAHARSRRRGDHGNLSSDKAPVVRKMVQAAGDGLLYLPPCSPDLNPIEQAFSKLTARLRYAAERTLYGLWNAIGL